MPSSLAPTAPALGPGDLKQALVEWHARLRGLVARRIPADLRSSLDAEDVLQDAYTLAFRNLARFVPRRDDALRRWVTTIVLRRLRNYVEYQRAAKRGGKRTRAASARLLAQLDAGGRTPSRSLDRREGLAALREALAGAPSQYRTALRLVYLEGRAVQDAAQVMGRSPRAVHGLCRRGLALLRAILAPGRSRGRAAEDSGSSLRNMRRA